MMSLKWIENLQDALGFKILHYLAEKKLNSQYNKAMGYLNVNPMCFWETQKIIAYVIVQNKQ